MKDSNKIGRSDFSYLKKLEKIIVIFFLNFLKWINGFHMSFFLRFSTSLSRIITWVKTRTRFRVKDSESNPSLSKNVRISLISFSKKIVNIYYKSIKDNIML